MLVAIGRFYRLMRSRNDSRAQPWQEAAAISNRWVWKKATIQESWGSLGPGSARRYEFHPDIWSQQQKRECSCHRWSGSWHHRSSARRNHEMHLPTQQLLKSILQMLLPRQKLWSKALHLYRLLEPRRYARFRQRAPPPRRIQRNAKGCEHLLGQHLQLHEEFLLQTLLSLLSQCLGLPRAMQLSELSEQV